MGACASRAPQARPTRRNRFPRALERLSLGGLAAVHTVVSCFDHPDIHPRKNVD